MSSFEVFAMMRRVLFFGLLATVVACGGGAKIVDDSSFRVTWPARTRGNVTGVQSALSARITFPKASPTGTDVVVNVQRIANPVAYTQIYKVGKKLNTMVPNVSFQFFAGNGQTGEVVATGTAKLEWYSTTMDVVDIALDKTVTTVAVVDPPAITPSTPPFNLLFEAKDAEGNSLALTPGSAKWSIVSGGANMQLSPSGVVSPIKVGTTVVRVEVDGIVSAPYTITIVGHPTS